MNPPISAVTETAQERQQRRNEIDRIVDGGSENALANYHLGTHAEMIEIHDLLSRMVDPEIEFNDEWKQKAMQAQQSKSQKVLERRN